MSAMIGPVLKAFLCRHELQPGDPPDRLLRGVGEAFSAIPYENLTKIIKDAECGIRAQARRTPDEVIADHLSLGTGGTCFSLTSALIYVLRSLGWETQPILADRPYGNDTHCALLVWIGHKPHLLDPGYLITNPIPLEGGSQRTIRTSCNELILASGVNSNKLDLHTIQGKTKTYRLTYKTSPVDEGEFRGFWEASFAWDMMRYPLLTTMRASRQLYLRANYFQAREADSVTKLEIPPDQLAERIASEFGIAHSVVCRALSILRERGEGYGRAAARRPG